MRIIGGKFKSRKILFPKNRLTRPMTDRSKETLFDILGNLVDSKRVLDLYAGSGSLGLEAFSRGAAEVTFVDQADWAARVIQKNIEALAIQPFCELIRLDIFKAIDRLEKKGKKFSLIFVDPPFMKGLVKKTLMRLDSSDIVAPFAQVVVGHARQEPLPESFSALNVTRTKRIGQACLSFLFRVGSKDGETKSYLSGDF
ncbi:MAG: 16S rRNA (guanine(966)-N(2))-methyltransferase RsmD [Candidatus Omnitrophota bacterium]